MPHVFPFSDAARETTASDQRLRFELLYRRWYGPVVRLCRRHLGEGHDAEAVAQEAFIRAWRSWSRYAEHRPFGPWVTTIARRLCITEATRAARRQDILSRDSIELPELVDDGFRLALRSHAVERALRTLAPRARRLLLLRDVEARPYEEIARLEGTSVNAVRLAIMRARAAFRTAFERVAGTPVAVAATGRSWWERARRMIEEMPGRMPSVEPLAAGVILLLVPPVSAVPPTDSSTVGAADRVVLAEASVGGGGADRAQGVVSDALALSAEPVQQFRSDLVAVADSIGPLDVGGYYGFAVSPNYAEDRTVYAVGQANPCEPPDCEVLLRSTDGGETWTRLQADGLFAGEADVLLPPDYPRDARIFVQGRSSETLTYMLAVSQDGGESFQPLVSSGLGSVSVTMSPRFATDDPRILIGATSHPALVYRDDTKSVEPLHLPLPLAVMPTYFAFGHHYDRDGALVVSASTVSGARSGVFHCTPAACARALEMPVLRQPYVVKGPETVPGSMFVWTFDTLYRSSDDGRSFERMVMPEDDPDLYVDEVLPGPAGRLFVRAHDRPSGRMLLFVSDDLGDTWTRLSVPDGGRVYRLAVLPDGVLLASLTTAGRSFACSTDGGLTWESRCRRAS